MRRTRIATVGYLNARPLTADLDHDRYDVVEGVPASIARMLADREVDAALVPVVSVLADPALRIVPGQAIGADGPVTSVLLVAEKPMEAWTEVLLDGESRTSAVLARLLLDGPLADRVRDDLAIREVPPGTALARAGGTTAALVIGDAARRVPEALPVRLDLAEAWTRWTSLPFVFAVWAGREGLDAEVRADLRAAARSGVARRAELVGDADRAYVTEAIRYDLDDRALMGLRRFAALAHRAGLLPHATVSLFGPAADRRPRTADVDRALEDLLAGAAPSADVLLALLHQAPTTDLGVAADLVRRQRNPDGVVSYLPADDTPTAPRPLVDWLADAPPPSSGATVSVGFGDESPEDRARGLLALRRWLADHPDVSAVELVPVSGDTWRDHTATDVLRFVALARLVLPVPHLVAAAGVFHPDVLQARLALGCDAIGAVPADRTAEIERLIREAGFTPARRDASFTRLLAPLTDGASIERRQPWTRTPAPA